MGTGLVEIYMHVIKGGIIWIWNYRGKKKKKALK